MRRIKRLQKATDLWCEGINDLGCKWFCELENKQNPDLCPWDRGGRFLKSRRFRKEEWSFFTRRNFLVTSCCGHNKVKIESVKRGNNGGVDQ
jgi:hypothetical protein